MVSNIWLKRKLLLEAALLPAIIILVAVAAYGLGRLSALQASHDKLVIHPAPSAAGESGTSAVQ